MHWQIVLAVQTGAMSYVLILCVPTDGEDEICV